MDKQQSTSNNAFKAFRFIVVGLVITGLGLYNLQYLDFTHADLTPGKQTCPVSAKVAPATFDINDNSSTVFKIISSPEFREKSADKLSRSIQIDTQIGDVWPSPDEDPARWAKFKDFHKYLEATFPSIYENLKVETVNTYGLVYTWEGSDASLKPSMYTAHQDTVPVQEETIKDWTYSPLSGYYDGTTVFGRGASDCKNTLVALLESVELLIAGGFKPKRTVLLAFGFDEEASGYHGAQSLAKFLGQRYGKDGIYSIIDEGTGVMKQGSKLFGIATVREKGYTDLSIELTTPGGHSSLPPDHTSIGIMSQLVDYIESDQYTSHLSAENPYLQFLQCQAEHSDTLPDDIKDAILKAKVDSKANSKVVDYLQGERNSKYMIQTSQAIDIITGGAKANALPESTKIIVNHRIAIESSGKFVIDRMTERVLKIADKNGLGVYGFDGRVLVEPTTAGFFNLTVMGNHVLEPSPVTPSEGEVWNLVAGTTRHLYEDVVFPDMEYPLVMAPVLFSANTDTRYYWNLTRNIFRYTPCIMSDNDHVHSVDEQIAMDAHLQTIAYFHEFIQSVDA